MEFTVFTSAGGFREFVGESEYHVGEQNGCLYAVDGKTGQVVTYGPMAWASVQEWQREGEIVPPAGESRRTRPGDEERPVIAQEPEPQPQAQLEPVAIAVDLPPLPRPQHAAIPETDGYAPPRQFDPLSDPLETFAD